MSTYTWHRLYEAAVLETDRDKLPALVEKAELAIRNRCDQMRPDDGSDERRLLESALRGLETLRGEMNCGAGQRSAN
jgi:hypothetical protein